MLRVDAAAWLTEQVAVPELNVWLPPVHAMVVVPSANVTVPTGVPEPGLTAETFAVYVTAWPLTDGFADDVTVVVVRAASTTWLSAADEEAAYGADPAYAAVIERLPVEGWLTTQVAVPDVSVWLPPEQAAVAPSTLKTTSPVGVPEAAVTVAV